MVAILKQGDVASMALVRPRVTTGSPNTRARSLGPQTAEVTGMRTGETQMDVCGSGFRESCTQGSARKKALTLAEKREAVHTLQETHGVSIIRGCVAVTFSRSAYYQVPCDWVRHDRAIIEALNQ